MSAPCPECDAPLIRDDSFCRECGYDADLQAAHWQGDDVELPEDDDYEQLLAREGLGDAPAAPWGKLLAVALLVGLLLLMTLRGWR